MGAIFQDFEARIKAYLDTPAIAQFYFETEQHYPRLKEYVRRLNYLRLLLLEYLQAYT